MLKWKVTEKKYVDTPVNTSGANKSKNIMISRRNDILDINAKVIFYTYYI